MSGIIAFIMLTQTTYGTHRHAEEDTLQRLTQARPDPDSRTHAAFLLRPRETSSGGRRLLTRLWEEDPLLTGTGLFLLATSLPTLLGLWIDPRDITGAPAWLKPTKFAISTGIYTLTLAWVFTYLPGWTKTRRLVGRVTIVTLLLEIGVIDAQAWRGTTSHFNVGTPLDAALFAMMGIAILLQTLASVGVAVALWRQPFVDRALGWALRLGMTITIVGALSGGLMTSPTPAQLDLAKATGHLALAGGHTVGAPDGGEGLPLTGWSTRHGDLRVPHFVGLHALQVLPLIPLALPRRGSARSRTKITIGTSALYALAFVGLLIQALVGVPLVALT